MGKNNEANYARKLSESVDDILKGEQIDIRANGEGDEYSETLAFAQRLVERRINVRPAFKASLRSKLLSQLNQEEVKMTSIQKKHNGFWGVLKHLIPRNPVWQTVTVVIVFAIIGGVVWLNITPTTTPEPTTPISPTQVAPIMPLRLEATTEKKGYLPGEEIKIELSFTNVSSKTITISPMLPEMEIISSGKQDIVRSFVQGSDEHKLEPGKTLTNALVWDQKDNNGQLVSPGYYLLNVGEIQIEGTEPGATGTRPGNILEILIKFPQGTALERTVEVNESVSANGVTITLMRVETSAAGTKVYALASLDEGSPQMPALPTNPMLVAQAFAQYSVDGAEPKQAVGTGEDPVEGGVGLFWGNLDPFPSDSQMLTFTIVSLDEQQGPWEFEIPLQ